MSPSHIRSLAHAVVIVLRVCERESCFGSMEGGGSDLWSSAFCRVFFFSCALQYAQVKIQQDTGSPTVWGDACCVMLSGTLDNVVKAQQMILERIANISDRLKEMVSQSVGPW